jgi:hypothetical protein
MNFSIFDIDNQINNLTSDHSGEEILNIFKGKTNIKYMLSIDLLMHDILNKKTVCKELFKLQEEKRSQFARAFADAALLLEYLMETENYLGKIKSEIVNTEEKDITLFVLEKMIKYFLMAFKEIYVMSINDCFLGATGRYRIFLEIYCIFKYFNKYPKAIGRFADHFLLKDYLMKKHFKQNSITPEDIKTFDILRKKYKDEYSTFRQNYGWTCQKLRQPNSIKELIKLAVNDNEFSYMSTEYNIVSEYSHASLSIAMMKYIDINSVYNFLGKSGDFSITVMRIYIGWIIEITKIEDKRLLALSDFLGHLKKYLYDDYNGKI